MAAQGGELLKAIGRHLENLGENGLRTAVYAAIEVAAQETHQAIRESAREIVPKSGGLAEWVAESPIYERTNRRGTFIIQGKNEHDLKDINKGKFRHPVFGRKDSAGTGTDWVEQKIEPGYFDKPIIKRAPLLQKQIEEIAFKAIRETLS